MAAWLDDRVAVSDALGEMVSLPVESCERLWVWVEDGACEADPVPLAVLSCERVDVAEGDADWELEPLKDTDCACDKVAVWLTDGVPLEEGENAWLRVWVCDAVCDDVTPWDAVCEGVGPCEAVTDCDTVAACVRLGVALSRHVHA